MKCDNETKATFGLMVAGMAKDMGLTLEEATRLLEMAWNIASEVPGNHSPAGGRR
jgi:hypothetical protein